MLCLAACSPPPLRGRCLRQQTEGGCAASRQGNSFLWIREADYPPLPPEGGISPSRGERGLRQGRAFWTDQLSVAAGGAAVDADHAAGDISGPFRGEEGDHVGEFLRAAVTAHRDRLGRGLRGFLNGLAAALGGGSVQFVDAAGGLFGAALRLGQMTRARADLCSVLRLAPLSPLRGDVCVSRQRSVQHRGKGTAFFGSERPITPSAP